MDLNLSSFGTLVPVAPCSVFYELGLKFTERLTWMTWFSLVLLVDITHRQTHTGHKGTNRLTHKYK